MSEWDSFVAGASFREDKIIGAIVGHAIGDAAGNSPDCLSEGPADWSKNTDQLLLVMQSLIENSFHIIPEDIAAKIKQWSVDGLETDEECVGLTPYMAAVINSAGFAKDPVTAATAIWIKSQMTWATNWSLTHASILGTTPTFDATLARRLSEVTSVDPRCVASCVLQARLIHELIYSDVPSLTDTILQECVLAARPHTGAYDDELAQWVKKAYTEPLESLQLDDIKSYYVFRCVSCSIYALHVIKVARAKNEGGTAAVKPSFKKIIQLICGAGGDSAANCAVSGAVLGAYSGFAQLPTDWFDQLPDRALLQRYIISYIEAQRFA